MSRLRRLNHRKIARGLPHHDLGSSICNTGLLTFQLHGIWHDCRCAANPISSESRRQGAKPHFTISRLSTGDGFETSDKSDVTQLLGIGALRTVNFNAIGKHSLRCNLHNSGHLLKKLIQGPSTPRAACVNFTVVRLSHTYIRRRSLILLDCHILCREAALQCPLVF